MTQGIAIASHLSRRRNARQPYNIQTSTRAEDAGCGPTFWSSPSCVAHRTASHTRSCRVRRLDRRSEASIADIDGVRDHPAAQQRAKGRYCTRAFTGQGSVPLAWWMLTATSTRPPVGLSATGEGAQPRGRTPTSTCRFAVRSQFGCARVVYGLRATFVTALFDLGVTDTQTGCKLFRRDVTPRCC